MASLNKVILVGNLGKDPEVRHLEGGSVVATFSLATSETFKDRSGNKVDQTEWHNIVLWGPKAEFAEKYLKKGNTIMVEGKLKTRSWEDKEKVKRYTTEIFGDNVTIIVGSKRDDTQAGAHNTSTPTSNTDNQLPGASTSDDLPF